MTDFDFIIRKFFLNFTIKDKKVASYTQNSPFGEFAGHGNIRDGRPAETALELYKTVLDHLNPLAEWNAAMQTFFQKELSQTPLACTL